MKIRTILEDPCQKGLYKRLKLIWAPLIFPKSFYFLAIVVDGLLFDKKGPLNQSPKAIFSMEHFLVQNVIF